MDDILDYTITFCQEEEEKEEEKEEPNIDISNQLINEINSSPTIKHIVLSGGGVFGFSAYGALEHLHETGYWNINNIESIHGTSVGAIFGTIISLKYEWSITHDYVIKRPWNKVFNFNMYSVINSIQKRGIFDISTIKDIFKPLFGGLDIPLEVTMSQLYEITKIDLHLYITNLSDFETVNISHKTHPDWAVIDAVYASSALPILFSPFFKDTKYYLDGGILCNYPIKNCVNLGADEKTVLGIHRKQIHSPFVLNDESTIFDYLFAILYKILGKVIPETVAKYCNELPILSHTVSLYNIYLCTNSVDERVRLLNLGIDAAKEYRDTGNLRFSRPSGDN